MTDQLYTPDKGDLKKAWDWYRANQDKEAGITQNFRAYRWEFLRAWDEIQTAAEQRGAARGKVEGLREAADEAGSWGPACINAALAIRRSADRLEGDDETH